MPIDTSCLTAWLSFCEHVDVTLKWYAGMMYALRVLRTHGIQSTYYMTYSMWQCCQRYFIPVQYGLVTVQLQTTVVTMRSSTERKQTWLLRWLDKLYQRTVPLFKLTLTMTIVCGLFSQIAVCVDTTSAVGLMTLNVYLQRMLTIHVNVLVRMLFKDTY